jgi:hypothetical protein
MRRRASALFDAAGGEELLRYVLRPPIAQDKIEHRPDGLVRIVLKKPYADGTVAVDMDPLSLLSRLAASVPPPRHHTVRYAGVLGAGSEWRPRIVPGWEAGAPVRRAHADLHTDRSRESQSQQLARVPGPDRRVASGQRTGHGSQHRGGATRAGEPRRLWFTARSSTGRAHGQLAAWLYR